MQSVPQGGSINLDLIAKDGNGNYLNVISTNNVTIYRPNGSIEIQSADSINISPGIERFIFAPSLAAVTGIWVAQWEVVLEGGITVSKDEPFEVGDSASPYRTETPEIDRIEPGRRVPIDVVFRIGNVRTDAENVEVSVQGPQGQILITDDVTRLAEGIYRSFWDVAWASPTGVYVATWTGVVAGQTIAREETVEVSPDIYKAPGYSAGIGRATVGDLASFDAIFRTSSGTLWNPNPAPMVTVTDPTGARISYDNPERIGTGVYRKVISLGVPGYWHFDWEVSDSTNEVSYLAAIEVTDAIGTGDGSHLYDASVFGDNGQGGVQALVPWLEINDRSIPTRWQVGDYIDQISAEVSLTIGDYKAIQTDIGFEDRITVMARYTVELGAAAATCDAAHRQMVMPNNTDYGARLWERYRLSLENLKTIVDAATAGGDAGTGSRGGWAVSGPPAQFHSWGVGY